MSNIATRPAAVAGTFYSSQASELSSDIMAMLHAANTPRLLGTPKALIVPHAGYIYSGAVAATAYNALKSIANKVERVVLLGPSHRVPLRGVAAPSVKQFATPLGGISLDVESIQSITTLPQVTINDMTHAWEHSLEVQLPFLQTVLDSFSLVPFAVGDATSEEVAEVIERLWGGAETLIVISSDLSHYLPYETARQADHATAQLILAGSHTLTHHQACGGTPINGLLVAAHRHALKPQLLDLRNSGDTAGPRDRVVGYAAFAFCENSHGHAH